MGNPLRAVYDNAGDRATVSVNSVPQNPVVNLSTNNKNEVWRSAATVLSVTFTATWFSPETVSVACLPYCNFSNTATMRVRLYSDTACTALLTDSGVVNCSLAAGARVAGLTAAQSASAYSYAGGVAATVWLTPTSGVYGAKIDIVDNSNLQGYLEAARLVMGPYFAPQYNCEYGASVTYSDTTSNFRTDAGNLLSDVGTRHKTLSVNLSFLMPNDRANLWDLVKFCGMSTPVLISVFPENADAKLEQAHTVFGKFSAMSQMAAKDFMIYSMPMDVESL